MKKKKKQFDGLPKDNWGTDSCSSLLRDEVEIVLEQQPRTVSVCVQQVWPALCVRALLRHRCTTCSFVNAKRVAAIHWFRSRG
jgi:hypothetical protein